MAERMTSALEDELLQEEGQGYHSQPEPEGSDPIAELSKAGYHALKAGELELAEESFVEILVTEPTNNYALVGLGDVSRKRGDLRKAEGFYLRCLEAHPHNNYALFGLADCYKALNQYAKALAIWEDYLKRDNQNITVLTRVADAYRKTRSFSRSRDTYLQVLELEPTNAYALIGLGHLHYDFKDFREALRYWTRVYSADVEHADVRVLTALGNCHRKMKTYADGLPFFKKVLTQEPDNFYALFGMADCYRGLNLMEDCLYYWNEILNRDPHNKVILTRAGDALRQLGRLDEARDHYTRALDIEFDQYAVLGLALIAKEQKNYGEAIRTLGSLLRNDPNNPRVYVEMAECYMALRQRHEALDILHQFQRRGLRSQQVSDLLLQLR